MARRTDQHQRQHQRQEMVRGGKEGLGNDRDEEAAEDEIVPLLAVADDSRPLPMTDATVARQS
jgi:hypothetical protein